MIHKKTHLKRGFGTITAAYAIVTVLLIFLVLKASVVGGIDIGIRQLLEGLYKGNDTAVNTVVDVRMPRIVIAVIAGAALAISGTLLQAVMKNPLTDPGIIGISSAAALVGTLVNVLFPMLFFSVPLLSVLGGLCAYLLIYSLAWDGGVQPTKLILVGVALNLTFTGIAQAVSSAGGGAMTGVQSIVSGNIAQKTWGDARMLAIYAGAAIIAALCLSNICNLLNLDDKTARGLGVAVDRNRFIVAFVAIILASIATSVVGIVGFLGLLVPHIARHMVGSDHRVLLPFAILLGAFTMLLSDTIGRAVCYPYEIPAAVIMAVCGGPFFIALLKVKGGKHGY